jgi:hypothetical protein
MTLINVATAREASIPDTTADNRNKLNA